MSEITTTEYEEIKITHYETPWEIACRIINAEHEVAAAFGGTCARPFFCVDDLRKIGEHLVNYSKTEKGEEYNG